MGTFFFEAAKVGAFFDVAMRNGQKYVPSNLYCVVLCAEKAVQ